MYICMYMCKHLMAYDAIFMSLELLGHLMDTCTHAMVQPSAVHGHYSPHVFPCLLPCPIHAVLIRCCKSHSSSDDVKVELKGVHSNFEDAKLELNPVYEEVTPSQAQTEPQPYEEFVAIGGVTSDSVAIEENPAYQLAEPAQYECVVGVTSRPDVQTEEDPAYQSIDTTEYQTEEPVYV